MKNKKGFTIIEIIVCISIIAIISTISVIYLKKDNNLNKKLLEAASVFVSIEKDENGTNYYSAINEGAKGVEVPIKYLVEKGYIDNNTVKEIYKINNLKEKDNYYVAILNGGENNGKDYCSTGELTYVLSWTMNDDKPVYLCNDYKKYTTVVKTITNIKEILNNVKMKVNLDKNAVSEEYYNNLLDKNNFVVENGIYTYYDEIEKKTYSYYRGSVDYNYLKFGKDKNGNDLIWRIVWINDDNIMKLVLDEEIPIEIETSNGLHTVSTNDKIVKYDNTEGNVLIALNPEKEEDESKYKEYEKKNCSYVKREYKIIYTTTIKSDYFNSNFDSIFDEYPLTFYYQKLENWYDENLKSWYEDIGKKDFNLLNNAFCYNNFYYEYSDRKNQEQNYYPSNRFFCYNGSTNDNKIKTTNEKNDNYTSYVGFLTYGEIIRAGIAAGKTSNIVSSGNYLLKNSEHIYPLADKKSYDRSTTKSNGGTTQKIAEDEYIYILNNNGITSSNIREKFTYKQLVSCDDRFYYHFDGHLIHNSQGQITTIKLNTNSIKPVIAIDMNGKKLSGSGSIGDEFIIETDE